MFRKQLPFLLGGIWIAPERGNNEQEKDPAAERQVHVEMQEKIQQRSKKLGCYYPTPTPQPTPS